MFAIFQKGRGESKFARWFPARASAARPPFTFGGRSGAVLNQMKHIPDPPVLHAAFFGESVDAMSVR